MTEAQLPDTPPATDEEKIAAYKFLLTNAMKEMGFWKDMAISHRLYINANEPGKLKNAMKENMYPEVDRADPQSNYAYTVAEAELLEIWDGQERIQKQQIIMPGANEGF